ncbi:MAG: lipocalin family protein [Proteobacteria bacterium]|nr:lipocalin family protein [Pseudomonadota bacterium]
MRFHLNPALIAGALATLLAGCSSNPPLPVVARVDLPRFMGPWYVIAAIPTRIERNAYDAVESYRLGEDGRVFTTFTFREGSFDGPLRRYEPVGFVDPASHGAVWGMRFVWPIRADYRVMYLDDAYTQTIIARQKRDYAWIMARKPQIPDSDYQQLVGRLSQAGYDVSLLRRVPQRAER